MTTVHPRVCGADASAAAQTILIVPPGSPPRVRGRRNCYTRVNRSCCNRFTPACAGQTGLDGAGCGAALPVHPRVCGADFWQPFWAPKRLPLHARVCGADAHSVDAVAGRFRVHPRVCGADDGSYSDFVTISRFTPACAGQTIYSANSAGVPLRVRFTPACAGQTRKRSIPILPERP